MNVCCIIATVYCCIKAKKCHNPVTRYGDKDDLRLWKLQLFAKLPSPLCQEPLDWPSRSWDIAKLCHLGPPSKCRCTGKEVEATWAPSIAQARQGIANLVMMFGYAHGGYLMTRTIPLFLW